MSGTTPSRTGLQVAQLAAMAELYPDEVGYRVVDGGRLTFGAWDAQSNRFARGLVAAGVCRGDRVAISLSGANALRWIVAYAAVHKAGAVAVPLDPRLARLEVARMFAHAGVVAVVTDGEGVAGAFGSAKAGSGRNGPPALHHRCLGEPAARSGAGQSRRRRGRVARPDPLGGHARR